MAVSACVIVPVLLLVLDVTNRGRERGRGRGRKHRIPFSRWATQSARLLVRLPLVQPAFQRRLTLSRWSSRQQVVDTYVFVQIGPMDSTPTSDQTPGSAFLLRAAGQPWIPCERHGNRATIRQINEQCLVVDVDGCNRCHFRPRTRIVGRRRRRVHGGRFSNRAA